MQAGCRASASGATQSHVKFRDSKLTLLLREVFTDPLHRASFVACLSPTSVAPSSTRIFLLPFPTSPVRDILGVSKLATPKERYPIATTSNPWKTCCSTGFVMSPTRSCCRNVK